MAAYWYEFTPTGVHAVDRILSAVAEAGKAFHDTQWWDDSASHPDGEPTVAAKIQQAADEAAAEHTRQRTCWCGSPVGYRPDKGFIDCLATRMHDWRGRELAALTGATTPTDHVSCSRCGKRVSNDVPGSLIVRAFIECPECIGAPLEAVPDVEDAVADALRRVIARPGRAAWRDMARTLLEDPAVRAAFTTQQGSDPATTKEGTPVD